MILIGSQKQSTCVGRALLRRRAWARTVGAEHAAISRLRPQQSASIPVYLAGCKRTAAPLSRFFFHEYDWEFDGRQTLRRIDEAVKRLRSDIEMARTIIKTRTKAGADVFDALDGTAGPAILNADQAKSIGLVDEVCELRHPIPNGTPIAMWT